MSRIEENKEAIKEFIKSAVEKNRTNEEMVVWQIGAMNCFLADISKSLAVIADNISSHTGEERSEEQ